jgi:hypothetical protein
MIKYQLYNQMNSPLPIAIGPLSAPQSGAKPSSPSLQSREGERGGEYNQSKSISLIINIHSR